MSEPLSEKQIDRPLSAGRSRHRGMGVAPSPFNAVKFELALVVVGSVLVMLLSFSNTFSAVGQWLLLGGYGVAAALWVVVRTGKTLRRLMNMNMRDAPDLTDGGRKRQ